MQIVPLLAVIVATVVTDSSFSGISPYIFEDSSYYNLIVFFAVFVSAVISQYLILKKIGKKFHQILLVDRSKLFHKINTIAPFALLLILFTILLEIYVT